MALAKQAALAKRTRPDNHLHSFRRHHQEVRARYAIAYRNGVDLTGQPSNPQPALCQLADLDIGTLQNLPPEQAHNVGRIPRSKLRSARPLKPAQVEALVAGYRAGRTMKELAAVFDIDRRTVSIYIRGAGVATRGGGLDGEQVVEAARLYEAGWSSGRLAGRFEVSADNVLKSLRRAGVAIRPRRGGPVRKERAV